MTDTVLTLVVEGPLLNKGGTVVVLVTRIDQATFDERYPEIVPGNGGQVNLEATVESAVTFVEFDAPPGFEYRFRTRNGEPVANQRVSVGEGGGYLDAQTGNLATSSVTFHHHIAGPRMTEKDSASLLGSYFRIEPATCRRQSAVRVCSGNDDDLEQMLQAFERSEKP